ncbi:hypothetical protein ACJMK2_004820 [Sinanodonta woodiana]|uniref:Uncharacterized protein n=1 Tax=Sinanodonta woodiana TaxID=1069815 RepID=A0ABD3VR60_SINWO
MWMSTCRYTLAMLTITALVKNTLLAPSIGMCREPDPEVLLQLQMDHIGSNTPHWTFWLIPEMEQMSRRLESIKKEFVNTRTTYLSGSRKCPTAANILEPECPKYYVIQHDPNRIPQNLIHVQCSCKKCLSRRESDLRSCQPVYAYTPVLRRTDCENEIYKYEYVIEAVPVSCICSLNVIKAGKYRPSPKMIL